MLRVKIRKKTVVIGAKKKTLGVEYVLFFCVLREIAHNGCYLYRIYEKPMAFEMLLSQDGFLFLETLSNTAATAVALIDRLRFFFLSVFFARW